jgi:hypothetical protein
MLGICARSVRVTVPVACWPGWGCRWRRSKPDPVDRLAVDAARLGAGASPLPQESAMRQSIEQQFGVPLDVFSFAGYGLFVGKKAQRGGSAGPRGPRAHA